MKARKVHFSNNTVIGWIIAALALLIISSLCGCATNKQSYVPPPVSRVVMPRAPVSHTEYDPPTMTAFDQYLLKEAYAFLPSVAEQMKWLSPPEPYVLQEPLKYNVEPVAPAYRSHDFYYGSRWTPRHWSDWYYYSWPQYEGSVGFGISGGAQFSTPGAYWGSGYDWHNRNRHQHSPRTDFRGRRPLR